MYLLLELLRSDMQGQRSVDRKIISTALSIQICTILRSDCYALHKANINANLLLFSSLWDMHILFFTGKIVKINMLEVLVYISTITKVGF